MTFTIGGMALTEMPALFFFSIAIYLLIKNTSNHHCSYLQLIAAGCCISLAITGRQPYLLSLLAVPVLFSAYKNINKCILQLTVVYIFSLALPCYVFFVWGGVVPVIEGQLYRDIAKAGVSYRPDFFVMCIGYYALGMFFIAPAYFIIQFSKKLLLTCLLFFLVIAVTNFLFRWVELVPLRMPMEKIFNSPNRLAFVANLCGSFFIFASTYFLLCMFLHLHRKNYGKEMAFFSLTLLLTAAACIKITWGFSSRYAAQGIPSLVLLGSYFYKASKYNILLIIIGILIGLTAFISFFTGN